MSRIRTNLITNRMANGAPTVSNGLVISGVTTSTNVSVASSVTATTYYGSGANLTNITQTTINNNADNRVITGSGTANTLEGEANLTFSGSTLKVNNTTGHSYLKINSNDAYSSIIHFGDQSDDDAAQIWYDNYQGNGMYLRTSENTPMSFFTNGTQRLRITSDGVVNIGANLTQTTYPFSVQKDLDSGGNLAYFANSDGTYNQGITLSFDSNKDVKWAGGSGSGGLMWNMGTRGYVWQIGGSEKLRIDSSGRLAIGTNNPDTSLTVQSGGDAQMSLKNSSGTTKAYIGTAGVFGSAGTDDLRIRSDSSNIVFGFSGTERLRITSDGVVTMPNQPSFRITLSGGPQSINGTVPFDTVDYNIGSNFNNSNHRFTAPVAGRYQFNFYSIYRGNHTNNAFGFQKNGGGFNGDRAHFTHSIGNNWDYIDMAQVFNLAAGDYVTCHTFNSVDLHGGYWSAFSGHLVG